MSPRTALRLSTVKPATLAAYRGAVEEFASWCLTHALPLQTLKQVDHALTLYFTSLYLDGEGAAKARYARFGYILLRTSLDGDKAHSLPESRKALQGFATLDPGVTREPLPECVVYDMIVFFLKNVGLDVAVCALLQYDTYARPSEALCLVPADFSGPAPAAGASFRASWCVNLANAERGLARKNGECDDAVRIGSPGREWIKDVVGKYLRLCKADVPLFNLDLAAYERAFRRAAKALRLGALKPTPHSLRHSGPSNDAWAKTRSLAEIQARGGWKVPKSVSRYEKHGMLLRQLARLDTSQQKRARSSAASLGMLLVKALP